MPPQSTPPFSTTVGAGGARGLERCWCCHVAKGSQGRHRPTVVATASGTATATATVATMTTATVYQLSPPGSHRICGGTRCHHDHRHRLSTKPFSPHLRWDPGGLDLSCVPMTIQICPAELPLYL